ncbi:hypothetical protein [Methylocystis echinoides]|jgi:hypothetical protein|uniref:hypothetical protein n=1 Tax=Methylocystis echinoides TaxID=29468 RepID=UPI003417DE8E
MVRVVLPWFTKALKRIVKTAKLHFLESGLLATVCGLSLPEWLRRRQLEIE